MQAADPAAGATVAAIARRWAGPAQRALMRARWPGTCRPNRVFDAVAEVTVQTGPAAGPGEAASWAAMRSASLASAGCPGCREMTPPAGQGGFMQAAKADFLALSTFEVGLVRWRRSCSWSSGMPRLWRAATRPADRSGDVGGLPAW